MARSLLFFTFRRVFVPFECFHYAPKKLTFVRVFIRGAVGRSIDSSAPASDSSPVVGVRWWKRKKTRLKGSR